MDMRRINRIALVVLVVLSAATWFDMIILSRTVKFVPSAPVVTNMAGGVTNTFNGKLQGFSLYRLYLPHNLSDTFCYAILAITCLAWTLVTIGEARRDGELRCRKCRYILRGLSKPRCPECGEAI